MSRQSLRRQLFHRNLDLLFQNGSLDTVEEEGATKTDTINQVLCKPREEPEVAEGSDGGHCLNRSPIYKASAEPDSEENGLLSKQNLNQNSADKPILHRFYFDSEKFDQNNEACTGHDSQPEKLKHMEQPTTPYLKPWNECHLLPSGRPGTPYTEIDENAIGKKSIKPEPLIFKYPEAAKRDSLPFSPIKSDSAQSLCSRIRDDDACKTCCKKDEVRSLPMSPVVMMSQSTSTPGPSGFSMNSPHCRTLLDTNSIFNFSSECNMCRICHEDGSEEPLVSPCHCAGTMGMLHISCLEQWLGSSNTTKCEICQFQFFVQKKPRSFKWYMQEPSLHKDKTQMIRDIVVSVAVGVLTLVIVLLCLVFAQQLSMKTQTGPAVVLIMLAIVSLLVYSVWLLVAGRRMRLVVQTWHKEHHIVQIKQKADCDGSKSSNKIFRRFPNSQKKKKVAAKNNLILSTCVGSLESYKAAMFNPVTPCQPLLQDDNNNDITSLDETSPSVVSLDEIIENCVSYYQPPEKGVTTCLLDESGKSLKETGV